MTARLAAVVELIRVALEAADKLDAAAREEVYRGLLARVRAGCATDLAPAALVRTVEPHNIPEGVR